MAWSLTHGMIAFTVQMFDALCGDNETVNTRTPEAGKCRKNLSKQLINTNKSRQKH